MKGEILSIQLCDMGDNYPIYYKVSSETTAGPTAGWHLIEILNETFTKELTFRYDMIDEFIDALTRIREHLKDQERWRLK